MTEILANEWGFIGYAVTDIYDDVDLWSAVLNSGTTCFDTRGQAGILRHDHAGKLQPVPESDRRPRSGRQLH